MKHACRPDVAPPINWLDAATADADDAARIQRGWMQMTYDQMDGGAFVGRFRMLRTPDTLVVTEQQNRTVLKQQHSPAHYCTISLIRKVAGRGRCGLDALHGQSIGYMPGGRDYEVLLPPSEILYFGFDQRHLLQAADTMGLDMPENGQRPVFLDGLDAAGLNDLADTVMSLGTRDDNANGIPSGRVNREYLDHVVLERTLDILLTTPARATRIYSVGAHRITENARALIDGSPNEPLTVMMLCQALHVSRATLQRAFLQIYSMSPHAWLRLRRLNGARRALLAGRDSGATVSAIAMHWGFFHLSRFAQDYCQQFGERPSVTLG